MTLLALCILAGALAAYYTVTAFAGSRAVGIEKIVQDHERRCATILED